MIEAALKEILEKSVHCRKLVVENQSALHAGHASSPQSGESHFHVLIVSDDFESLSRLQRHQLVNNLVFPLFSQGLHALALTLLTDV